MTQSRTRPEPLSTGNAEPDAFKQAVERLSAARPIRNRKLQQASQWLAEGQVGAAEKLLAEWLDRRPRDPEALSLMARARLRLGHRRESAALLERCLEIEPGDRAVRFNYAELLYRLKDYRAALAALEPLLAAEPENPLARQLKANILESVGENDASLAICQRLVEENPRRAESWISFGHALRATGDQKKSVEAYRKAIEIHPHFGMAYWALANLKTVRFSDADIAAMQDGLTRADISPDDRTQLQYALGKALEDRGEYERSFDYYAKANAVMRLRIPYDPENVTRLIAGARALFTAEFLERMKGAGCAARDPIFVLGLPRSGSTLIEQILSSHSAIEGTAELPYITALAKRLEEVEGCERGLDYPAVLTTVAREQFETFGRDYLERTRIHRKLGRPYFIDKKPPNFFHVGLIHLILPNAKIIDARRHPVACCFSQFKQYFNKARPRQAELGRFYREYVELMAHFDRVLPGRVHRVIYEELVSDPQFQVRRLFDYLELPFEEGCLRFYETKRTVLTPSSEQVRRPISGEAVDHWRHYAPWLGPLIESLGTVLSEYPSVPADLR